MKPRKRRASDVKTILRNQNMDLYEEIGNQKSSKTVHFRVGRRKRIRRKNKD